MLDEITVKFTLYIFNLAASDNGQYKCTAAWSDPTVQTLDSQSALLLPAGNTLRGHGGVTTWSRWCQTSYLFVTNFPLIQTRIANIFSKKSTSIKQAGQLNALEKNDIVHTQQLHF